mgnify:CR=1 FL=1
MCYSTFFITLPPAPALASALRLLDTESAALKRKAAAAVAQIKVKATIRAMRAAYWWEKFDWFVSSENLLVLCARDGQQVPRRTLELPAAARALQRLPGASRYAFSSRRPALHLEE